MPKYIAKSFRATFNCHSALFQSFVPSKFPYVSQKFDLLAITFFVISTFFLYDLRVLFDIIMSQVNLGNKRLTFSFVIPKH